MQQLSVYEINERAPLRWAFGRLEMICSVRDGCEVNFVVFAVRVDPPGEAARSVVALRRVVLSP
jgi:hypothetical protein